MELETHGSKVYLVTETGVVHVPGTLYLNEQYSNPHTKEIVAKALRVWVRLADAFSIDLAARALETRWLTETEKKALKYLVYRPIKEIESMSDRAVKAIASANKDMPNETTGAVQRDTAIKQLVGIADFLTWFHQKVLEPRMPLSSVVSEVLRQQVEACTSDLKKGGRRTKSHPHQMRSVPTARFLQIYSAVYLHPADLLKTAQGKVGNNLLRDRATLTPALTRLCERVAEDLHRKGYRGRTIGLKIKFADFKIVTRDLSLPGPVEDAPAIRRAVGECLKRVSLDRRIRLIGVRIGSLEHAAEKASATVPTQCKLPFDC